MKIIIKRSLHISRKKWIPNGKTSFRKGGKVYQSSHTLKKLIDTDMDMVTEVAVSLILS